MDFGNIKTVGLIGCGRMGQCMAGSMLAKGLTVIVYDKISAAAQAAASIGAQVASSPKAVAEQAETILMSLPGPEQLEAVLFGPAGMAEALGPDHIVIDTSTVDPQTTRKLAQQVWDRGAAYLDCPILGRPSSVGMWILPTGGQEDALRKVKPILLCFAANAILVGGPGAGNALKLLNQMMFSCINAISAEVMAICDHVGIRKEVFYETVSSSTAATVSGLFREVGRSIVNDAYETPAFTVDLLLKDTRLALQMAKDADAPSLIAGTAQMYNEVAHSQGLGKQDTSALYKVFSRHYEALC